MSDVQPNNERDERLQLHHQRQPNSLMRNEAARSPLADALCFVQDESIPRISVEFRPEDGIENVARRWRDVAGLGAAVESYVSCLRDGGGPFCP